MQGPEPSLGRKKAFQCQCVQNKNSDPDDIMSEVYENGPVEVAFNVYEVMSSRFVSSFPCIILSLSTKLPSSIYQGLWGVLL